MPIFRVKSVKIYTGQKNLHWQRRPRRRQLSGMHGTILLTLFCVCSAGWSCQPGLLSKHPHLAHKRTNIRQLTFEDLLMVFGNINRLPLTAFVVGSVFFFHGYFFSWVIFSFKIIFRMLALIHHVYKFCRKLLVGQKWFFKAINSSWKK